MTFRMTSGSSGATTAITIAYLAYLLAPIALLAIGSVGDVWRNTLLPTGLTDRWYLQVWSDRSFRRAFETSLIVCGATVAICALIGAPMAYAIHSAAGRGVRLAARIVYLLPIAVPPIVLAFGMLLVFSSDALPFLGERWVLIGGHVVLCLPYLLQALVGDMRHLDLDTVERAAESLGASFPRRFFDVVLPSLRHSLLSGSIAVAALSIGEFQLSNLIAGFLDRTYPVLLLQAFYGAAGFACAATMVLLALAALAGMASVLTSRGAIGAKGFAA
jgi:putative spermidine/putrescine transport system permease protein